MSNLNTTNDLFLGKQELDRLVNFLQATGYIRIFESLINNFGIANANDDTFDNFKVEVGTNPGTIKIAVDSVAVDENINIIFQRAIDNFSVTDDNSWYWVRISHIQDSFEEGTVSITESGNVTGANTKFSEVLRDQSNYPVKITFPNSTINTSDYQVVSVLSDTQAVISGVIQDENAIQYQLVGSFTPGVTPVGNSRLPYLYDSCNLELVAEVIDDTPPPKTDGEQFYIARVRNNAGTVDVQDKRTEILSVLSVPVATTNTSGTVTLATNTVALELISSLAALTPANLAAVLSPQSWVEPTLNTGFINNVDNPLKYRKNRFGHLEIAGKFAADGNETNNIVFTLPTDFRPTQDQDLSFTNTGGTLDSFRILADGSFTKLTAWSQAVSSNFNHTIILDL